MKLNVKFKKAIPTTEPELTIKAKVAKQARNQINGCLCQRHAVAAENRRT